LKLIRLLLDAHISPSIAKQLQGEGIDTVALRDWQYGHYLSASDEQILIEATVDKRVLVTYDLRTIPPLLKEWAETGQQHSGVILIDEKTLLPNDVGGLLRAIRILVRDHGDDEWQDQVVFLRARG